MGALARLPEDAVVHVVVPRLDGDDRVALTRRDDALFAGLATHHHGIYAELSGAPDQPTTALESATLELVRPTRIDGFAVVGVTEDLLSPRLPTQLREGDGVRGLWLGAIAPTHVVVIGTLWSDPIRADVVASSTFSRQTAALVFGADAHTGLSDAEMMTLAMTGHAVSPVTSYVAAEPGTRPSPIGLDDGGFGIGSMSGGASGGGNSDWIVTEHARPRLDDYVDAEACLRDQPAANVELDVETTRDEIVDVTVVGAASPRASCLVEAVWNARLDAHWFDNERDHFKVAW
jgi:hypothetical protein